MLAAGSVLTLKAIYSRSLASAESAASGVPGSHAPVDLFAEDAGPGRSFDDVIARPDITGVIIALPIALQPRFIEAALRAGKHVLAEKPVGPDVEGARRLIASYRDGLAAAAGSGAARAHWSVAEQFRYLPKYVWAAEQARALGRVIGFHFRVFQLCTQGELREVGCTGGLSIRAATSLGRGAREMDLAYLLCLLSFLCGPSADLVDR